MAVNRIIVLFNLKPGKTKSDYEAWARTTDLPTVNALGSVADFAVFEMTGLLGSDGKPPYEYVEILDVDDMEAFGGDIATPVMQRVAAEFQLWADAAFVTTRNIDSAA